MHSKNTALRVDRNFVNRAPNARYVRRMAMKANDKQIGLVIEQKADDDVHGVAFQQMSFQLHALAQSGVTGLGV